MEPRFGYDFSHVRVHADAQAAHSAEMTTAEAYTVGNHIVFASGRYAPMTSPGRRLLAHELTHVVQQQGGRTTPVVPGLAVNHDHSLEQEADRAAESVAGGQLGAAATLGSARAVSIQRATGSSESLDQPEEAKPQCVRDLAAAEFDTVTRPGVITVIEFRSRFCKPCAALGRVLNSLCDRMSKAASPMVIRFLSIDVNPQDEEGNLLDTPEAKAARDIGKRFGAPPVPHLLIFREKELTHHSEGYLGSPETYDQILAGIIADATSTGIGKGAALGALAGGVAGLALGLGLGLGGVTSAGDAALAGLGVAAAGVGVGILAGFLSRRTQRRRFDAAKTSDNLTPDSVEALIRRRYGRYLGGGPKGPLNDARVHAVSRKELCEIRTCRMRTTGPCPEGLVGWTDTGEPLQPLGKPKEQAAPIASQADESTCNGRQLEHATPEQPVIYYVRESVGTLIHEGLHAVSHPSYGFLHNAVAEGTTEYFTRKLEDDIGLPHLETEYDGWVESIEKLVGLIGEEVVARAYFNGGVSELHQAANARLGRCALIAWALSLQARLDGHAEEIMNGRNGNYCNDGVLVRLGISPSALTPGEAPAESQLRTEQPRGGKQP